MNHLDEGALRAHIDGQLDADGARHLAQCAACRARLAEVARLSTVVQQQLGVLSAPATPRSAGAAWRRFQREYQFKEHNMMTSFWHRFRPLALAGVGVAVIAIAFTFTPVQQAFSQFLALFRVQQVATLPIDFSRFDSVTSDDNAAAMRRASQAFADTVEIRSESDLIETVTDAAEASALAGFPVRVAEGGAVQHVVRGGSEFVMMLDAEKTQAILTELGRDDLVFPVEADGAALTVVIPTAVTSAYGECPQLATMRDEGRRGPVEPGDCLVVQQLPSPTVTSDKPFNPADLAALALQVAGMDADEAQRIAGQFDWATTLVVPMPRDAAVSTDVSVDGVTGKLITSTASGPADGTYSLIWAKDGFLYAVVGTGDPAQGLALAESLE